MKRNAAFAALALAGIAGATRGISLLPSGPELGPDTPSRAQTRAFKSGRDYPATGTGKRQGARLARQHMLGQLNFWASEKCIRAIKARLGS